MSRSGYNDDYCENQWANICYRGAVASAIRGKRGQAFLREMLTAMDAMPDKRLIRDAIVEDGSACAIGTVALARGLDVSKIDPEEPDRIAEAFGIPKSLVREIEYENDEANWDAETPENRFDRVRKWIVSKIKSEEAKV